MTHLPYIIAAYALGVLIPGTFATTAFLRMRIAQRRLATLGPRVGSPATGRRGAQ